MKTELPTNHGLSSNVVNRSELVPCENDRPLLTDIQHAALCAGIGNSTSLLISAPTSTGKTLIGWWAVASAIEAGRSAVYLVSHRALAKQKFEEAKRLFLQEFLQGDASAIICATGDSVEDAAGRKTNAPLAGSILVATYEKFLGTLSVGGPPRDLTNTCFICDEVQIVGDKHRGQNVELLLTLLRRAGWAQFIGLSAVLGQSDAEALAGWLNVKLVRDTSREKAIEIELRTSQACYHLLAGPNFEGEERQSSKKRDLSTISTVAELVTSGKLPLIVFCMKVDDTYDLANRWCQQSTASEAVTIPNGLDIAPPLTTALQKRVAYHNAELTEEERLFVEGRIAAGYVDIVFATSTLAAGVNFPLSAAVFASWVRYNSDRKTSEPIGRAEFQNMAGRVGRMGQVADKGYVVLCADGHQQIRQARSLISLTTVEELGHGITSEDFGSLTLQLFAGKLCASREDAFELLSSTLTASRELSRNRAGIDHWKDQLFKQIDRLVTVGCLTELPSRISVTPFGVAVAHTGLKPETALYFIEGLKKNGDGLVTLIQGTNSTENELIFVLSHAVLTSPEFGVAGGRPTRTLNWRIGRNGPVPNSFATQLTPMLFSQPWTSDAGAANGALQVSEWAAGGSRSAIEGHVPGVRLGTVQSTARDVAWVLTGISEIVFAITSPTLAEESKPASIRGLSDEVRKIRQLARAIRRQAVRLGVGVPSDVVWMSELKLEGPQVRLHREQIMALRRASLVRPFDLMDGSEAADESRRIALGLATKGGIGNNIRTAARRWRKEERDHCKSLHIRRARKFSIEGSIAALYEIRGDDLEKVFEEILASLVIPTVRLDTRGRQAYPDFQVSIENFPVVVFEIKSKQSDDDLISLNAATEVLAASELAGLKSSFCITLCSPAFDPSVPGAIERASRLCVVEVQDFCEAVLRLHEGSLTRSGFYNWLTTPGIALSESLPMPN